MRYDEHDEYVNRGHETDEQETEAPKLTTPQQLREQLVARQDTERNKLVEEINTRLDSKLRATKYTAEGETIGLDVEIDLYPYDETLRKEVVADLGALGYQIQKAKYGQQRYVISASFTV